MPGPSCGSGPQETPAPPPRSRGSALLGFSVEGFSREEELVDVPSEDKHHDDPSEEQENVPPEEELVLVEATLITDFEKLGAKQGLP